MLALWYGRKLTPLEAFLFLFFLFFFYSKLFHFDLPGAAAASLLMTLSN